MSMLDRILKLIKIGGGGALLTALILSFDITVHADSTAPGTFEPLPTGYKKGEFIGTEAGKYFSDVFTEYAPSVSLGDRSTCSKCGINLGYGMTPVTVQSDGTKAKAYYYPCVDKVGLDCWQYIGGQWVTNVTLATQGSDNPSWSDYLPSIGIAERGYPESKTGFKHTIRFYEEFEGDSSQGSIDTTGILWRRESIHWHVATILPPTGEAGGGMYPPSYMCTSCANEMYANHIPSVGANAHWSYQSSFAIVPISYSIRYNANGGTGTMTNTRAWYQGSTEKDKSLSYYYSATFKIKDCGFTRLNYDFIGWNTKADGTGTAYSAGQVFRDLTTEDGKVIDLYAQWKKTGYTITFDTQGGTYAAHSGPITSKQVADGCLYTKPGIADYWLYASDGTHYLVFNDNDWSSTENCSKYKLVATPEKTSGVFLGWYTQANGGTQVFDRYGRCVIKSVMQSNYFTGDTTLYAHWEQICTITFDTQGGFYPPHFPPLTSTVMKKQEEDGYLLTRPGVANLWLYASDGTGYTAFTDSDWTGSSSRYVFVSTPEKSGSFFLGWFTSPSGGTMVFDAWGRCRIKSVMQSNYFTSDTTLYAQWRGASKIYIDAGGGTYGRLDEPRDTTCYCFSRTLQDNGYFWHGETSSYGIWVSDVYNDNGTKTGWGGSDWDSGANKSDLFIFDPPSKEGYLYGGVFTEKNGQGEQIFEAGTGYCLSKELLEGTKFSGDTTLYVYWIPLNFTITWDYNKPSNSSFDIACNPKPSSTLVQYTTSNWSGVPWPSPSITGWKFLGWYNEDTRYDTRTGSIALSERKDITLKAKWESVKYALKYVKDGSDS